LFPTKSAPSEQVIADIRSWIEGHLPK